MRRRATVGILLLCGVVYAVWRVSFHGADPRLIFNPPVQPPATPPALMQTGEIDVRSVPFREAMEGLARRYDFPVVLDEEISLDAPVTLRLRGVTVHSLVRHLVRQQPSRSLTTVIRNGALHLTTVNGGHSDRSHWETRLYTPLATDPDSAPSRTHVRRTWWQPVDSWNPSMHSWDPYSRQRAAEERFGDAVLLTAPREIHELTAWLRGRIEQHSLGGPGGYSTSAIFLDGPYQSGNSRVRAALDKPIDVQLQGMSLPRFAEVVGEQLAIPVVIETPAIAEFNKLRDPVLRGRFRGVPLRRVLRLVLPDEQLGYFVADEALVISSISRAETVHVEALYPVRDLARWFQTAGGGRASGTLFETRAWEPLGSYMSLRVGARFDLEVEDILDSGDFLRVSMQEDRHAKLADTLASFRQQIFPWSFSQPVDLAQVRLHEALAEDVILEADESLDAFARRLTRDFQIDVWIDHRVGPRSPLRVRGLAPQGTLKGAIDSLLLPLHLAAVECGSVLVITLRDERSAYYEPRWYRFRLARPEELDAGMLGVVLGTWCGQAAGVADARPAGWVLADSAHLEINHPPLLHEHLQRFIARLNNGCDKVTSFAPDITGRSFPSDEPQESTLTVYPIEKNLRDRLQAKLHGSHGTLEAALGMGIEVDTDREFLAQAAVFDPSARNEMVRIGEYLFAYTRGEMHELIGERLAALRASLHSPISENAVWQVVVFAPTELSEDVTPPILYDVRPLENMISIAAWGELSRLLLDACEPSKTAPQLTAVVVFRGYVAADGTPEAHEKLRRAFDYLARVPALATALRQASYEEVKLGMGIRPDPEIATPLMDAFESASEDVERRLAAWLLASRAAPVSPIGDRLLRALRRAGDAQQWWLVEQLCETISRTDASEAEAAELLEQLTQRPVPESTLRSLLHALVRLGYHGGDPLLRLTSQSRGADSEWMIHEMLRRWTIRLLDSLDTDDPQIDEQLELLLRKAERDANAITTALLQTPLGYRKPMSNLERELIRRDIIPPRSEQPFR